jgi:LysM repeat protein
VTIIRMRSPSGWLGTPPLGARGEGRGGSPAPGLPDGSLTQSIKNKPQQRNRKLIFGIILLILLLLLSVTYTQKNALAEIFINNSNETQTPGRVTNSNLVNNTNATASSPTFVPASATQPLATLTTLSSTEPGLISTPTILSPEATSTAIAISTQPSTYIVQRGEYPYCIARRFNLNPDELLSLNSLSKFQTVYIGTVIKLPQTGNTFPGDRRLREHPTTYTVSAANETIHSIACAFGDLDPTLLAQANNLTMDVTLSIGQTLNIP